jgi:2-polyprenyl-3-methyl-5-hydroxy-6-metoxy-1,4-benzoquinol methylase
VCGGTAGQRFHSAILDFAAWKDQDRELAAYTGESIALWRCRTCGFAQPERMPALPNYFERMYDQQWSEEWVAQEFESPYKDLIFTGILAELDRRIGSRTRSLLDIGSHAGRFLHLAVSRGWRAEGTEINARTAAYAAAKSGAVVHRVRAEQIGELGTRYDAVTLTDVLEHIPQPVSVLTTVLGALEEGGWIAVKVPCGPAQALKETWRARLSSGYRATLADNLVHVSHFSPEALRRALERAGFVEISIAPAAPECPPGGPASALFRRGLYSLVRALPDGVNTPLALHLQAFARRRAQH